MSYSTDKAWEQQTAPMMIDALLQVYHGKIEPASATDDAFHGTDFIWTKPDDKIIRLAMRVRESSFLRYKDDFTIREDRPKTGHKTELEKIRNKDWAHVYAYGFSDGKRILYWSLFRMSRFNPDAPFQYMPMCQLPRPEGRSLQGGMQAGLSREPSNVVRRWQTFVTGR